MDIQARKQKLIEWILQVGDSDILSRLEAISHSDQNWWDTLPANERASIERGLNQANNGQLKSHDEVMEKYSKWL